MSRKITHYELAHGNTYRTATTVDSLLKQGFQPYGMPFALKSATGTVDVVQAMVRYEDNEGPELAKVREEEEI